MKLIILFLGFFAFINLSTQYEAKHPHGHSISAMNITHDDGKEEISVDLKELGKLLRHPDVKDRKVVVFSIIGALRKGKSFFLDYCLRFLYANYESINTKNQRQLSLKNDWLGEADEPLKGFTWRGGIEATTRGILFWNDVFLHIAPNGDKIAIIIMDTQGLFEIGISTPDTDARIFGLSTLLSSIQIINLMGVVQEDHIQHLEMVTDFSRLVLNRQEKIKLKTSSKPFQNLLFLIRDWNDEDYEFSYNGGEKFLKEKVFAVKSSNKAAANVRSNIQKSYDKIDCFLLPHPGLQVSKKQFTGAWQDIDAEFVKRLKILIESLLKPEKLIIKKFFNKEITGNDLMDYAQAFFKDYQSGELPQVGKLYNSGAETFLMKLIFELNHKYLDKMENRIDFSRQDFNKALNDDHDLVKMTIISEFEHTPMMGDDETIERYTEELIKTLEKSFNQWKKTVIKNYNKHQEMENEKKSYEAKQRKEDFKNGEDKVKRGGVFKIGRAMCKIFSLGLLKCK